MVSAVSAVPIAAGIVILLALGVSVMRTLVVPRGLVPRFSLTVDLPLRRAFRAIARITHRYEVADRILSYEGPVRLMAYLVAWLTTALIGYSLIYWPFVGTFPGALDAAGSSMFTLGFFSVHGAAPVALAFSAAATGLVLVALQIAYLPTIYAAFNRRETLVTMLSSRTGQPPWGPEVLARHSLIDNMDDLPQFFRDWELWAADLAETHTNYPVLLAFRAPHPLRHWVIALNAILDAAALYLALAPHRAPSQANAFIRMGYSSLREVAHLFRFEFDPDPLPSDPIELTYEEFADAVRVLDEASFPRERTAKEAWPHFHGWRVNYERLVYGIADRLVAPPALWSGPRQGLEGVVFKPERPAHRKPDESAERATIAAM
ncbi:MAG: hypothetical protein ABR498_07575 [Candidatus Dormibacteria bacterium]